MATEEQREQGTEEPPPFFSRWRAIYAVVIGELVLLVVIFYLLSRWAS